YSGLPGGPGRFTPDFTGPVLLGNSVTPHSSFVYGGHTLYAAALTTTSTTTTRTRRWAGRPIRHVPQPPTCNPCRVSHRPGLASSAFARHYSRNHCCFLFLRVLRCFTSPRSLHTTYTFSGGYRDMTRGGFPHSDILGSQLCCQLPEAFRRLTRPSSAPLAKASTVCPLKLTATHKNAQSALQNCLQDARVHYVVLKKQPHTHPAAPHGAHEEGEEPATHPTPPTTP